MKKITIWNGNGWQEITNGKDNDIWFAVVEDDKDTDHGTGSFDLEEAKDICRKFSPEAYIVAVDPDEDFALAEIKQEDF